MHNIAFLHQPPSLSHAVHSSDVVSTSQQQHRLHRCVTFQPFQVSKVHPTLITLCFKFLLRSDKDKTICPTVTVLRIFRVSSQGFQCVLRRIRLSTPSEGMHIPLGMLECGVIVQLFAHSRMRPPATVTVLLTVP